MKAIIVCSGGLDSVTLAYKVAVEAEITSLVSFNYGQRHDKELNYAALCAKDLNVPHHVVDISHVGAQLTGSALTDDIDVPDGHYAEDSMKVTVVPNRNAIMLTIAYGMAASQNADTVAIAVHGGDHFIYPDCRPDFIEQFAKMQKMAMDGYADVSIYAPFLHGTKGDIVTAGTAINVPYKNTWSCYKGGDKHCGRCGTCVERAEAFYDAGVTDPTDYADSDFWQNAVKQRAEAEA
ncbi:7-cyano-7-deazaguanine synthase QueC [Leucothrix arctica]|uniref:7-cyano-7-deazaguanine synthase n=1 Tax=Leucothrix arctica TaxID=1481894 RepID=A0A317C948_9GAMM|nr:7-cyano-7-deazaguanine synthase QueC [Leucothrix arctica]PWQ95215.1 7-cyano-7-deazaguanine synthase QueC [Leucothrix arctica]